jgi:uncharacterized protein
MKIEFDQRELGQFCKRRGIARLELFGSALGDNFRSESDIDLLATLDPSAHPTLFDWEEMREELTEILGREVDLVSRRAIESSRNAYRKRSILSTAQPFYG